MFKFKKLFLFEAITNTWIVNNIFSLYIHLKNNLLFYIIKIIN